MSIELSSRFDRAFGQLETLVAAGRIPGGVLGIVERDGTRAIRSTGLAQKVPRERPMTEETWFDLASVTKVIFTTMRILELADEGVIDLDAPLTTVLPDLRHYDADAWERRVTFRQCLAHRTPFPAVEPIYTFGRDPDLLRTFVIQREWKAGPPVYSDINFILLGFVLERLTGKTIRELDPGPGFAFSADPERSAATEDCYWRHRVLCGEVHDDNCSALQGAGHAGLFGTAGSVLDFAQGMLEGTIASPRVMEWIRTPLSATHTHGWQLAHKGWAGGDASSPGTIGHTGFTGTGVWIDFEKGRAWTLLTNRIHPTRHYDSGIFSLRPAIGDIISQDQEK